LAATRLLRAAGFEIKTPNREQARSHSLRSGAERATRWEAAIAADRAWNRRCAQPTAAVGVGRPLPQNPGADRGSGATSVGAAPVGAALAATRLLRAAGFEIKTPNREQARSHSLRSGAERATRWEAAIAADGA